LAVLVSIHGMAWVRMGLPPLDNVGKPMKLAALFLMRKIGSFLRRSFTMMVPKTTMEEDSKWIF